MNKRRLKALSHANGDMFNSTFDSRFSSQQVSSNKQQWEESTD